MLLLEAARLGGIAEGEHQLLARGPEAARGRVEQPERAVLEEPGDATGRRRGALCVARVLDPDRLRTWLRHTPDGIHRYFFQYKLTLLEIWCRTVVHGERPEEITALASNTHVIRA